MQLTNAMTPDAPVEKAGTVPDGSRVEFQQNGDRFSARVTTPMLDPNADGSNAANGIPEKFGGDVGKLTQAYLALEKEFHARTQGTPAAPVAPVPTPATTPASTPTSPMGLDMGALSQEFSEKGALSPETYTTLAAKGYDKQTVDTFIAGQQALAVGIRQDIATVAGGEEQLGKVLQWAQTNLSPAQLAAYEAATATKNVELVKLSLQGIVAAHAAANPPEPKFVSGQEIPGNTGARPFGSNVEMVEAINSPKYQRDPAYRAEVARRLAASMR